MRSLQRLYLEVSSLSKPLVAYLKQPPSQPYSLSQTPLFSKPQKISSFTPHSLPFLLTPSFFRFSPNPLCQLSQLPSPKKKRLFLLLPTVFYNQPHFAQLCPLFLQLCFFSTQLCLLFPKQLVRQLLFFHFRRRHLACSRIAHSSVLFGC